ncbi:MAG: hypothetical protein EBY49_06310, partial [Actinobacteria bacterium]|nr:hypothetical protein [Actinomycetota bacterium]
MLGPELEAEHPAFRAHQPRQIEGREAGAGAHIQHAITRSEPGA